MPSTHLINVRLNQSDEYRAILTDTAPFEVPIIFSNDGFYKNLIDYNSKSSILQKIIAALVINSRKYTVPLRYNIVKDGEDVRTLSLIHPHSQVEISKFYKEYNQLICEYTSRSPYSIRRPEKVGTNYFIKSEGANNKKPKNLNITQDIERLDRNPESYFSYFGYNRLYRFFRSTDHVRLEKRFKFRLVLDVSKCFDSIYTHSVTWAVKNKSLAKENPRSSSFGNRFDKVMQKLNHNETSGICIGPETSRIFAEIIMSRVDRIVFDQLFRKKIFTNSDYECRRYVDNYYVFANSEEILSAVQHEISIALREYKLHLNSAKTEKLVRPFYTQKSLVIDKVNQSIQQLWDKTFDYRDQNNREVLIPLRIRNYTGLFGDFTRKVKAACLSSNKGYDAVANYIVAAMKRKLVELSKAFEEVKNGDQSIDISRYRQLMLFILDIGYYFFTLHPTVASSFRLSHTMVVCAQHMKKNDEEGLGILREYTLRWTALLANSPTITQLNKLRSVVPIEFLNILVALQEFSTDGSVESELFKKAGIDEFNDQYFQIVVQLFIYKDYPSFQTKRDVLFQSARKRLKNAKNLTKETELVYLLLDFAILSIYFYSKQGRTSV